MENSITSNISVSCTELYKSTRPTRQNQIILRDNSISLPQKRTFQGKTEEGYVQVNKVGTFPKESIGWHTTDASRKIQEPISVLFAGSGYWIRGCEVTRQGSEICSIEMVIAGDAWYTQEGKNYHLDPGQIFFLHPNMNHSYGVGPSGFLFKRFINVGGVYLKPILNALNLIDCNLISPKSPSEVKQLLKKIKTLTNTPSEKHRRKVGASLYELLLLLSESKHRSKYPQRLNQAMEYLQNSTHQKWDRNKLCDIAGVSATVLHRLFSQHLHTTPLKYFMKIKMRETRKYFLLFINQ